MHNVIPTQPHSGLGIASFIISLCADILLVLLLGVLGVLQSRPGGLDENSAAANTMGLGLLLTTLALTVALGLGIAALAQPGRNKVYGVLGTVFAATGLAGTVLMFTLGALAES
jgi:hypothetical protein